MNTKLFGKVDLCIKGAAAVGGTVATGIGPKVDKGGKPFEDVADVIAGNEPVLVGAAVDDDDEGDEVELRAGNELAAWAFRSKKSNKVAICG
jgi:hypothetical protein